MPPCYFNRSCRAITTSRQTWATSTTRALPGSSLVSLGRKQAPELDAFQKAYSLSAHLPFHFGIALTPLTQDVASGISGALWLLFASVAAVLLIACVNLASLQLARAVNAERETAIPAALGASKSQLVRSRLTESLLLALVGGAAGAALAFVGVRLCIALVPTSVPRLDEVRLSMPVLFFAGGSSASCSGSSTRRVAIPTLKSMDDQVSESAATDRFQAIVLTSFGAAALLLALIGIYGVLAYSVSVRQQEFGIRIALGSGKSALIRLVLRQAACPVLFGTSAGPAMAFLALRWVRSLLYQTPVVDPLSIGGSVALLLTAAAVAAIVPARRASSVDPMQALRTE